MTRYYYNGVVVEFSLVLSKHTHTRIYSSLCWYRFVAVFIHEVKMLGIQTRMIELKIRCCFFHMFLAELKKKFLHA